MDQGSQNQVAITAVREVPGIDNCIRQELWMQGKGWKAPGDSAFR